MSEVENLTVFLAAYNHTMQVEGGYANDPTDVGGETYKGISRVYHPSWPGWGTVDRAKESNPSVSKLNVILRMDESLQMQVYGFYKAQFWDVWLGDAIAVISTMVAHEMFDTGVNMGTHRAVTFLQRTLNKLDRNTRTNLVVDGRVGPITLGRLREYQREEVLITKMLNVLQGWHYFDYMDRSPTQEKYARGWFNRVTL